MNEPERLLVTDATRLERLLLEAVARERPSPAERRRLRVALGLTAAGLGAGAIKAAAAAWGRATLIAVVATGVAGNSSPEQLSRVAEVKWAPASALLVAPSMAPRLRAAPSERTVASEPAPAASKPNNVQSDLREEIRLIDQARIALRQQAPERALERLARYRARFPRGAFQQEAMVLRIEALGQSGDRARARALGQQFLAEHPDSPHAERVTGAVASAQ